MDPNSFPYADEWNALRAQRQREYEQMVCLMRWGALMEVTNEIANDVTPITPISKPHITPSQALGFTSSPGMGFTTYQNYVALGKGRM